MGRLNLYAIFHLNLMYSAIDDSQRRSVVEKCYWPLLRLASDTRMPLAIESTGHTLEMIHTIDPDWVANLHALCRSGNCEFVGSGYSQIIGPLVPAAVNRFNQTAGMTVYEQLLGFRPAIALINEQAFSSGLIDLYHEAGYTAVIMEWNNPVRSHPEWSQQWRYRPQRLRGTQGRHLDLIWNDAISFQQFQRFAHGETELEAYLDYLHRHMGAGERYFSIYGGDAEVFDFRPGRYDHEPVVHAQGEWQRIGSLFESLASNADLRFILPSQVLTCRDRHLCGNVLSLGSAEQPIPVKKQDKYNIVRWAVTGIDDLGANTLCWRFYDRLKNGGQPAGDEQWRTLCRLWASDYRTHITEKRWRDFHKTVLNAVKAPEAVASEGGIISAPIDFESPSGKVRRVEANAGGHFLELATESLTIRLNMRRGLSIDRLASGHNPGQPMVGTLAHGYFDHIALGADYYSGHMIFEAPGKPKATDLNPADCFMIETADAVHLRARIETARGSVEKRLCLHRREPRVDIHYGLDDDDFQLGSLRIGNITLCPEAFQRQDLFFETHNGGDAMERYHLRGCQVDHGSTFSFLISATQALGITEGRLIVGDKARQVEVLVDKKAAALVGMLTYREIDGTCFCRVSLSAREMDETVRDAPALRRLKATRWHSLSVILHDPPLTA